MEILRRWTKDRFSLLLLEEGEYYLEDVIAVLHLKGSGYSLGEDRGLRTPLPSLQGRLKLCSRSLMFDPSDTRFPVLKFHFRAFAGPLQEVVRSKGRRFVFRCGSVIEMKERGVNHPYRTREARSGPDTPAGRFDVELSYTTTALFLPRVVEIINIFEGKDRTTTIQSYILKLEARLTFDTSWLEDLRETQLHQTTGMLVLPLVYIPGRIMVTEARVYFQPIHNATGEIVHKFRLDALESAIRRRHLLRDVALELFFSDGDSMLFAFHSRSEREAVLTKIGPRSRLPDTQSVTLRWVNGRISNFDYLLYLNYLAGRTKNDLTQYPVFPWVVTDYSSPTLDLAAPGVLRNLEKPIGALNPTRLKIYRDRFEQLLPDPKAFMYGTHYSAPSYVLFFLVREAPELMLRLQNGRFDAPDRLFYSMEETWNSCFNNPADVKELIPEFYDLSKPPTFLTNLQGVQFGVRQNGKRVDGVELPPWASSPEDFVRQMRDALESPQVSAQLHSWIDLIFGYQQHGERAIEADNVFYHLTYEGAVDIESIDDPIERESIEMQIREFGQTPSQLFESPHPRRRVLDRVELSDTNTKSDVFQTVLGVARDDTASQIMSSLSAQSGASGVESTRPTDAGSVQSVAIGIDGITVDGEDSEEEDGGGEGVDGEDVEDASGGGDDAHMTGRDSRADPSSSFNEDGSAGPKKLSLSNDDDVDGVFEFSVPNLKERFRVRLHRDAVTDIKVSPDGKTMYTTSQDGSVKLFDVEERRQLRSANNIGDLALSSVEVLEDRRRIIVGSWDASIYVYSVDYGRILDKISGHEDAVSDIKLVEHGRKLVSCSWDGTVKIFDMQRSSYPPIADFADHDSGITSMHIRNDVLIAGTEEGFVHVWDVRSNTKVCEIMAGGDSVSGVALTPDATRVATATRDGSIHIFELNGAECASFSAPDGAGSVLTDGEYVLVGCGDGSLTAWELGAGEQVLDIVGHKSLVTAINVGPRVLRGDMDIATGGEDGAVLFWAAK
eukprot:TRINITY_DN19_c0_g1_i2.p1 TRINITY_DN19_c0_g1~~TRINITY_DN19_c0_g1_i2.p1  ORF type:complete len:1073 (-),score=250.53 TRINITY_DN19_c0_g1_i2:2522-5542(-)